MHQIEIKVRYPAHLELILKKRPDVLFSFEAAVRQLVSEHERFSWIPVGYAALYHLLAHAAVIDTRCVEISESGFHEPVDHLVAEVEVYVGFFAAFIKRQPHASEREALLRIDLREKLLKFHTSSFIALPVG